MKDTLPIKIKKNECGIINLDDESGSGTHWTCYVKRDKQVKYFDSFGNLPPPLELRKYFGKSTEVLYNYKRYQKFNTFNCGHLCIKFLLNNQVLK